MPLMGKKHFQFPRGLTSGVAELHAVALFHVFQFPRGLTLLVRLQEGQILSAFQFPRGLTSEDNVEDSCYEAKTFNSLED